MNKVLLIDDDEAFLIILKHLLIQAGFEVETASDGQEGMKKYSSFKPDLVITDLMMPFVSGLEFIKYLREDLMQEVPLIMVSAEDEENIVSTAFRLGANDYLVKPLKPIELVTTVKKILARHHRI
jgi:DNA-binding response OmpR family regulator